MSARRSTAHVHSFGGSWTKTKLDILKGYLTAYSQIFANNPNARYFNTFYVDAFAGSGFIKTGGRSIIKEPQLFHDFQEAESQAFLKGSAACALDVNPCFKNYLFIERSPVRCSELENLKKQYPDRASSIEIRQGDAKGNLLSWVDSQNWNKTRAVVFLDPYGMQVDWEILKALGDTHGVDLWLLFPLGVGVMRLLTKESPPPDAWSQSITRILGTADWENQFYESSSEPEFFPDFAPARTRELDHMGVARYTLARLGDVFYKVHPNPRVLMNSKNNPLYLFCFACGNEKGSIPAMKIAGHLLKI
jgi:three-Cys-motif partner protein